MFEPEDSATEDREKPSEAGFFAIILSKVIDEVSIFQSQSQNHIIYTHHPTPKYPIPSKLGATSISDDELILIMMFCLFQDFASTLTLGARLDRNPAL